MSWSSGWHAAKRLEAEGRPERARGENRRPRRRAAGWLAAYLGLAGGWFAAGSSAQVESIGGSPSWAWVSHARIEGHLAIDDSPAGAFAPDSSLLAVAGRDGKVALLALANGDIRKVLHPRVEGIGDLDIQAADFLSESRLLIFARGLFKIKGKSEPSVAPRTPLLAFQWGVDRDSLVGRVNAVGASGGVGPVLYFPHLRYLGVYKQGTFELWSPETGRSLGVTIPDLKQRPGVYAFSPDGHWLLLARIAMSASPDPVVIRLSEHRFVNVLPGHQGSVLRIAFSPDSRLVATACEDGKIRVWSVGDWKLVETLAGHAGPVHWVEFSRDGQWLASAGEDHTARIWSLRDGKLERTLAESREPLLTIAFSPDGRYLAASAELWVYVWRQQ